MALNFNNTCPIIDNIIFDFNSEIKRLLKEMAKDYYLQVEKEKKEEFIGFYIEKIYDIFGNMFEEVRGTNEEMRAAADYQIDELEEKLEEVENEKEELENQVDELEEEKTKLNTQTDKLENEITELNVKIEALETELEQLEEEIVEFRKTPYTDVFTTKDI